MPSTLTPTGAAQARGSLTEAKAAISGSSFEAAHVQSDASRAMVRRVQPDLLQVEVPGCSTGQQFYLRLELSAQVHRTHNKHNLLLLAFTSLTMNSPGIDLLRSAVFAETPSLSVPP